MDKLNYTPGPWRIVTDGISHWLEIEPNRITLVRANREDLSLLAASPDLLAALDKAEDFISGFEGDELQEGIDELLAEIRAAIAKAKGTS